MSRVNECGLGPLQNLPIDRNVESTMYRHILVPVDDSVLSAVNVNTAIQLARRLQARVCFFHAAPDLGATQEGQALKRMDPGLFAESAFGDTHTVLAKCAVNAESSGVPYSTLSVASDRPARAIIDAAQANGCDLIVMATHGLRGVAGWLHTSQTERVLRHSPVAVLVTRVASEQPLALADQVLSIIHGEHQSILAVVRAMAQMARAAPTRAAGQDLNGLDAMLDYLRTMSLQIHHPKEELFLHWALRRRSPQCGGILHDIESEHAREKTLLSAAQAALQDVMSEMGAAGNDLLDQITTLSQAVQAHIELEEVTLWPLARQNLDADDWAELFVQFQSHNGSCYGLLPAGDVRRLFTRIADLRPALSAQSS